MLLVQQQINEATPAKTIKRSLDRSTTSDDGKGKKHAPAFTYDKATHVFESENLNKDIYTNDRLDGVYKVNVRRSDAQPVNRIALGKFLTRNNIKNVRTCKKVSWNTACVHFSQREDANKFVAIQGLKEAGYDAFIPLYYRSVVGVVRNVPVDMSAKEIYDEISERNDILKLERMTRRLKNGHRDYSLNIKITFSCNELPKCVSIYHGLEKVTPYIPPLLQCRGCFMFGHHVNSCKTSNDIICQRCGSQDHDRNSCTAARPSCLNCKGDHEANSRECIERTRQENIRILMNGKRMTYREVLENFPTYTSSNQYNVLENLEDFPTLHRDSYRDQLEGKKSKIVSRPQRKRLIFSRKQADANSLYYSLHTHSSGPSTSMPNNTHKVSEVEKEITKFAQAMKPQTNFANNESICEFSDTSSITETELNNSIQLEETERRETSITTQS